MREGEGTSKDKDKVYENRLRRMAARQGLRYVAGRRRDPRAIDYGHVWLVDAATNLVVSEFAPEVGPGTILDQIEAYLTSDQPRWQEQKRQEEGRR